MLWTIVVLLLILWLLGFTMHVAGGLVHILLVVALPLQLAGTLRGVLAQVIWLPMLAFEVPLGVWLLVKGVRPIAPPLDAPARPARDGAARARQ